MKNSTPGARWLVVIGTISCLTLSAALAADTATSQLVVVTGTPSADQNATAASPAGDTAPVKLPYGVEDVLKLSRAQISEDIIQNYVQNSGTIYNLSPKDVVYLKNEGVSDRVVNTMLDQRRIAAEVAAQTAPQAAPVAPATPPQPGYAYPDRSAVAAAPAYLQPPPAEIQPAPSTVYVIPYPQATAGYYGYPGPYCYYGPYYGGYYGSSVITLHAGFGSGFRYGSRYRGYHGGYRR